MKRIVTVQILFVGVLGLGDTGAGHCDLQLYGGVSGLGVDWGTLAFSSRHGYPERDREVSNVRNHAQSH